MMTPIANGNGNGDKNAKLKENLQTTFVVVAIVSFTLTILVNFYTLRRIQQSK